MQNHVLNVELGEKSYPIAIGSGVLNRLPEFAGYLGRGPLAIVTNTRVAPLYLSALHERLQALGLKAIDIILPDGEAHKNWSTLNLVFDALLAAHCERGTPLLALGGGVVGDMGGFAAACYQRGMPFIQIPTTLLAQVDSSVGGKTAINHPLGKNMIGAFYQPELVLIDTDLLHTLPEREYISGLAEVIKYGLIRDLPFLAWLEAHIDALLARDAEALTYAIYRSCQNKAEVVARDEKENGERAFLNLGHTFAHAIETGLGYGAWLHGEAVAAGMMMAAELSARMTWLAASDVSRIERLLVHARLPVRGPSSAEGMDVERYLALMQHDKKVKEGKLRLVLLSALGAACLSDAAPLEAVQQAILARQ